MKIAVLTHRDSSWPSLREIIPALERAWRNYADRNRHEIVFAATGKNSAERAAPHILSADAVGVLFATPAISRLLFGLRQAGLRIPAVIHTHGEGTAGALRFGPLAGFFTRRDSFLCASRAEAACLRECFPDAFIRIAPFPIEPAVGTAASAPFRAAQPKLPPLFYAGRISEQKNLHLLLFSLWMLRKRRPDLDWRLEIYGAPDRTGSPNMGFRFKNYQGYLLDLCARLGLEERVLWKGWHAARTLERTIAQGGRLFVSSSLHSDEDFGVAALKSLLLGSRAVLSAWGGHRDFPKRFPRRVWSVPVYRSAAGPFLAAGELSRTLSRALTWNEPARTAALRSEDALRLCSESIADCLRDPAARPAGPLPLGPSAVRVMKAAARFKKPHCGPLYARVPDRFYPPRAFESYADRAAQPFFRSYGARDAHPAFAGGRSVPVLAPW
ncbi:MAG: glycosyltransferase, partial [Elusimicrobia bacterium]|nr:glycosyltransferase [Elusimicrobiota bacterium]